MVPVVAKAPVRFDAGLATAMIDLLRGVPAGIAALLRVSGAGVPNQHEFALLAPSTVLVELPHLLARVDGLVGGAALAPRDGAGFDAARSGTARCLSVIGPLVRTEW